MLKRFALFPVLALASGAVLAQAYPSRPIRMIIPLSAGGTTDTPGRIIAQKLGDALGQQVVVDNRPGAGGTLGTDMAAKSKADGYTLLLTSSAHVIGPHLYKTLPYKVLEDFVPISRVAQGPYVMVVHPSVSAKTVPEFIALAKSQPGKIDYASSGNGSFQHLVGAFFNSMAGIELTHVPYKGSGPATQDLVGGTVKVSFTGTPIALPHVKAGRLRALAVTSRARSPEMPDVPTVAEVGGASMAGYDAVIWLGLLAPTGTPPEIVQRLNRELAKILADPEAQKAIRATGVETAPSTPEEFAAQLKAESEKWGKVVKDSGAVVN